MTFVAVLLLAVICAALGFVIAYVSGMALLPGLTLTFAAFAVAFLVLGLAAGGMDLTTRARRSR